MSDIERLADEGIRSIQSGGTLSLAWQDMMTSRFNTPLSKEEREQYFGDALIDAWKTEFEARCWGSPQFAEMSFHTLFGQLPAIRKIPVVYENNYSDIRMHCMLFQRSGTGKGRGYDFTASAAKELDLVCMKADSTSEGMLLGSYEQIEGEDEPLHVHGLLDPERTPPVNIFMQNEATLMLDAKKTDWSKDFMTYYQVAMNPIGTPDNLLEKTNLSMRGEMVSLQPTVSFYLTTYPPDKLLETITKAGFIQRMTTLYNIHKFEERVEHWKIMAQKTGRKKEGDDHMPDVIAAMKYINSYYQKNNFISVANETHNTFGMVMKQLYRPLLKVNKAMREHLGDFVPRTYENVVKCAYQHAMTRLSPLVENVDIVYAMSVLMPAWQRMITYMEESDEIVQPQLSRWNKWRRNAQDVYNQLLMTQQRMGKNTDGWIKYESMVKYLSSSDMGWDKSPSTTRSRLDKMINDLKFFDEQKIKGIKCVKMRTQK